MGTSCTGDVMTTFVVELTFPPRSALPGITLVAFLTMISVVGCGIAPHPVALVGFSWTSWKVYVIWSFSMSAYVIRKCLALSPEDPLIDRGVARGISEHHVEPRQDVRRREGGKFPG